MRKLCFSFIAIASLCISVSQAQEPVRTDRSAETPRPAAAGAPLQYAHSYQQQDVAREYLLRRAQEKSEARRARIEGLRWLGYSPLRPTVTTTPFMGHAPAWGAVTVGGFVNYPYWSHPVNFNTQGMLP